MKHVYTSVMSAQFPVSFYVINSTNNVLKVVSGSNFLGYTLTLTNGNYNLNTLITEINSKFSSVGFPSNPTITQNKSTGKLTFAFSSNNTILAFSIYDKRRIRFRKFRFNLKFNNGTISI